MTSWLRQYGPAVAVFIGAIVVWEGAVRGLEIQKFLLPPPSSILGARRNPPIVLGSDGDRADPPSTSIVV